MWHLSRRLLSVSSIRRGRIRETRAATFNRLEEKDIVTLERILGAQSLVTDADELTAFNADWLNTCRGDLQTNSSLHFKNSCLLQG